MAQDAYPVPGRTVSLVEYRGYMRSVAESRAVDGLGVFADSTGRQVKVRSGRANVDGLHFISTALETLAIAANTSGNARRDAVVLRLDPATTPVVQLAVVTGVPSASPATPSLVQDLAGVFEFQLAVVAVPAGAVTIAASQVTASGGDKKVESSTVVHVMPAASGRLPAVNTWLTPVPYRRALILNNGNALANPARLELVTRTLEANQTTCTVEFTGAYIKQCRFNFLAIPI